MVTAQNVFDIRKAIGLEMEYEALNPNYTLLPGFHVYNEESVHVFSTVDHDPAWRRRGRPPGRYRSTAWIPGNFLSEGTMFIDAGLATLEPLILQFYERQAVAFQVVDSPDGDSARGDWAGGFRGVVGPLLKWNTEFGQDTQQGAPKLSGEGVGC